MSAKCMMTSWGEGTAHGAGTPQNTAKWGRRHVTVDAQNVWKWNPHKNKRSTKHKGQCAEQERVWKIALMLQTDRQTDRQT